MSSQPLAGKRAAVTGAASGIGAACARHLLELGADVLLLDRDASAVEDMAASLGGTPVVIDLSDQTAVDGLRLEADILVNNAGYQHVAPVTEFPQEQFDSMIAVMLRAPFALIKQVMPGMIESQWGRVINISSIHGRVASPFKSGYVSAKHGLEGLSKTVALEGGPHGVTSNCISPAYVRTPLVENQLEDQAAARGIPVAEVLETVLLARAAVKRLIEPDEVAELVTYLCGPHAQMINGASLSLDGGWTAH